jgi:A/G-specific adenine glycosylase
VAVVDGNVFRVLARLFGKEDDISSTQGRKSFFNFAQSLIPDQHPGIFNQAMMEFGALHCLPKNPKCDVCVFKKMCVAYAHDQQYLLPVKSKRVKTRSRYFTYFVFEERKKLAMNKRISNDIWKGLFDFYLIESKRQISPQAALRQDEKLSSLQDEISILNTSKIYRHILTHQKLNARFVSVGLKNTGGINNVLRAQQIRFYSAKHIRLLPKPVLVSRFLKDNYGL